jgi:hypothetical protein
VTKASLQANQQINECRGMAKENQTKFSVG